MMVQKIVTGTSLTAITIIITITMMIWALQIIFTQMHTYRCFLVHSLYIFKTKQINDLNCDLY